MRTIAFAGRKGGTGKTTSVINVAAWLAAEAKKRVLVADIDPQGNTTTALAVDSTGAEVWRLLVREDPLAQLIKPVRERFDLLPGGQDTARARDNLAAMMGRDARSALYALRDALKSTVESLGYDYMLIDCPPSLDLIAVNAILAADELAMPVPCQFLGAEGARQFTELAAELTDTVGGRARLAWVIPTFYQTNTKMSNEIYQALLGAFGELVTDPVRQTVRIAEAPQMGQTIFEYDPTGNGAKDYAAVARRIDYGV